MTRQSKEEVKLPSKKSYHITPRQQDTQIKGPGLKIKGRNATQIKMLEEINKLFVVRLPTIKTKKGNFNKYEYVRLISVVPIENKSID